MKNFKFNTKFIILTLIVALIVVPVIFNYAFMWESGWARGETSDWFTLYGNIIGSLIGGFFTYLALLLTFKEQKENKQEEMRPRIDIPYQNIDFIHNDDSYEVIAIEINNIGGSIAKNIECKLTILNFENTLKVMELNKSDLDFKVFHHDEDSAVASVLDEEGKERVLGSVTKTNDVSFVGSCVPMILNHEAKANYLLELNISNWTNYLVRNWFKIKTEPNYAIFNFNLEIKYSSIEYGDFVDSFDVALDFIRVVAGPKMIYQYVLKSRKVDKQDKEKHTS